MSKVFGNAAPKTTERGQTVRVVDNASMDAVARVPSCLSFSKLAIRESRKKKVGMRAEVQIFVILKNAVSVV